MIGRITGLILCLTALLNPAHLPAVEMRARSILVLDQSETRGPFYYQIFSGLRSAVNADTRSHTTLYSENLDLSRFNGATYEESPRQRLKEKYRDRPIGVVVAVGTSTLELVLRWREELWPGIPVVFALADEMDFERLKLPPDVTGSIVRLALADPIKAARAVVPDLDSVVFVGAPWERQVIFRNWKDEIPAAGERQNVQPLGAILTNAETAELILNSPSPDLSEGKEIPADIRRDDLRASEVIHRMRSFLKRTPFETKDIDLNDTMREVFEFLSVQASARNIALYPQASPEALHVRGDPVQPQQVILNLMVNSMDAMAAMPNGRTVVGRTEMNGGSSAVISISDSGPGIPPYRLKEVFDPFFTAKQQGVGIGLSIARTIVQAHKGRIWAENVAGGGAVFRLSLPLCPT